MGCLSPGPLSICLSAPHLVSYLNLSSDPPGTRSLPHGVTYLIPSAHIQVLPSSINPIHPTFASILSPSTQHSPSSSPSSTYTQSLQPLLSLGQPPFNPSIQLLPYLLPCFLPSLGSCESLLTPPFHSLLTFHILFPIPPCVLNILYLLSYKTKCSYHFPFSAMIHYSFLFHKCLNYFQCCCYIIYLSVIIYY